MHLPQLLDQYMDPLLCGRRAVCRDLVKSALDQGVQPRALYSDLIFPAMQRIEQMYREDRINRAAEHMATRVIRTVADHIQARLPRKGALDRKILITCAHDEPEELSAQMVADLFEADGWEVYFLGGGVPRDEVGELVGQLQPHVLLIFGSKPTDAPAVRELIDYVREINARPGLNIMVSGGVFNRASGLWREVKADLFAETAVEALTLAAMAEPNDSEPKPPGAPKKRRRRRRPPLLAELEPARV
jgi:methanogenic corrinoid protein MtbC1